MNFTQLRSLVNLALSQLFLAVAGIINIDEELWIQSCDYVRACLGQKCKLAYKNSGDKALASLYLAALSSLAEFERFRNELNQLEVDQIKLDLMEITCFLLNEANRKYIDAVKPGAVEEEDWNRSIIRKRLILRQFIEADFPLKKRQDAGYAKGLAQIINHKEKVDGSVFVPVGNMTVENNRLCSYINYPVPSGSVHPVELAKRGLSYTGIGKQVKCQFCPQPTHITEDMPYSDNFHKAKCEMLQSQTLPPTTDGPATSSDRTTPRSNLPILRSFVLTSSQNMLNTFKLEVLLLYVQIYLTGPLNKAAKKTKPGLYGGCEEVPISQKNVNTLVTGQTSADEGFVLLKTIVGNLGQFFLEIPKQISKLLKHVLDRSDPTVWHVSFWEICKIAMFSFKIRFLNEERKNKSSFEMDQVCNDASDFRVDALLKLLKRMKDPLVSDLTKVEDVIAVRNLVAHRQYITDDEAKECFDRVLNLFQDKLLMEEAKDFEISKSIIDEVKILQGYSQEQFVDFLITLLKPTKVF